MIVRYSGNDRYFKVLCRKILLPYSDMVNLWDPLNKVLGRQEIQILCLLQRFRERVHRYSRLGKEQVAGVHWRQSLEKLR